MLSLDLFNTKYERDLAEGAVDDLEARRIDTLNDRMQDLLARARESQYQNNPKALAALKQQFQQVKDERDSYYKVREAGIPGNVPTEKIPGKEDLLKGRGRTYYEGVDGQSGERKFPDPRKPYVKNGKTIGWILPNGKTYPLSKSDTVGNDGMIYHWQDPRAHRKESQKKNSSLGEKKLGQLRPSLGTGHDIGRSVRKFRAQRGLDEQGMAEGQVSDDIDHRGDVDTKANIEVPGVDLKNDTFKITYNGKPYRVKIQNFSQEGLGRWQIADYDVDIINSKGKNIIDLIDWDNDRQVTMVNTIIAYLDTQQASDIQLMAWRQVGIDNSTAEDLYQEIQDFYKNDQQKIDKATAWLAQNIEDPEERQVFADFVKNPVSRPARTKYIPKEYLMYVAFSYSREGNTELTPGMNLKPIQLNDPDDEEEFYRKVDELFKKVQFKFDAFENKIVELADSYGLGSDPDLGSGFGQREIVWDHKTMTTSSSESNKNRQQVLAKAILNFQANVEKYVASFNNTLIKIGLPGIGEYSTWSGVLGDQLTDQQVRYFATPEGFANLASGKVDLAKMLDDNVEKLGIQEHGGGIGPKKHWQSMMPEQMNPEDYEDEDEDDRLRSGDYVRDTMDGESGEIFRMQGDPYERRVRILDRDGRGWYIEPSRLIRVDPQDPDVQRYFGKQRRRDMDEGKADYNFDAEDLKRLERIRDLPTLKTQALALISRPSAKPMKPEKVEWFKNALDRMNSPIKVIKLMYDLLLSGEGHAVVGSRSSMNPNSYRQRFGEQGVEEGWKSTVGGAALAGAMALGAGGAQARVAGDNVDNPDVNRLTGKPNVAQTVQGDQAKPTAPSGYSKAYLQSVVDGSHPRPMVSKEKAQELLNQLREQGVAEGWSDAVVARRTGGPRTPYSVYIKGRKWKDFENEDLAQAVMNRLKAKFKADGRDPETVTIAPTDYDRPIKEEQDTSGVERAILNRIMVSHTDLLMKFGPDKVMQAAEEVAYNVGDVDEIGTSDVSAYVAQVKQILGAVA
jgi:hypothetical protein